MVYTETIIKTLDNSGASFVKCVKVLNNSRKQAGKVGDILVLSVREIIPRIVYNRKKHLRKKKMVQKGEVHRGILLCSGASVARGNGWHYRRMQRSSVCVITQQQTPAGSRILGPILDEVRARKHNKIAALASYLL